MLLALSQFCGLGGDQVTRQELTDRIRRAKAEAKSAGPIHRRDLKKHIRRMEKELKDYNRFHAEAARG